MHVIETHYVVLISESLINVVSECLREGLTAQYVVLYSMSALSLTLFAFYCTTYGVVSTPLRP